MTIPAATTYENTQGTNGIEQHFKPGAPISWFARQQIDKKNTLLDLRYLCRGNGMLVIAPSGLGKSTLSIQIAILWSCGRPAFGITTQQPMNILVVQAEDDQGDCTEMARMINHLGLKPDELKLVEANTELIRCNDLTGTDFIKALKAKLKEASEAGRPIDLIIINPYSTYLGDDVLSADKNFQFLNKLLNPVLTDFSAGIVIIHHTPKTNYTDFNKLNPWDWQYSGAGSAALTNWARAIMVIVPQEHDTKVFMFVAAKRGKRLELWEDSIIRYFKHADPGEPMQWLDVTDEEKNTATDAKNKRKGGGKAYPNMDEIIQKCISLTDWQTEARIAEIANDKFGKGNCGLRRVYNAIQEGLLQGNVSLKEVPREKIRPLLLYIRNNNNSL